MSINFSATGGRLKNRATTCRAMILPGDSGPLLGAILLEDVGVLIHPSGTESVVNPAHPYFAQMKLKKIECADRTGTSRQG